LTIMALESWASKPASRRQLRSSCLAQQVDSFETMLVESMRTRR
jgi:hypothetical protein